MRSGNMNLRKLVTIFFSAVLVMVLAACGNNDENNENTEENEEARIEFPTLDRENLKDDEIVAEFAGGSITGEEFARFLGVQAFLNPDIPINDLEYRKEGIKELVMKELLIDDEMDVSKAEEEAKLLWEQLESLYNKKELDNAYENLNISEEDIVDTLTSLYLLQSHFSEQITDEDIDDLYEAAKIDGASKLDQIKHVTLPGMAPTLIIMLMEAKNILKNKSKCIVKVKY